MIKKKETNKKERNSFVKADKVLFIAVSSIFVLSWVKQINLKIAAMCLFRYS